MSYSRTISTLTALFLAQPPSSPPGPMPTTAPRGGSRQTVLADVLIGAQALVERIPLLTRDSRRDRQAFPGLELIAPSAA